MFLRQDIMRIYNIVPHASIGFRNMELTYREIMQWHLPHTEQIKKRIDQQHSHWRDISKLTPQYFRTNIEEKEFPSCIHKQVQLYQHKRI